jgi:hypothetical protein
MERSANTWLVAVLAIAVGFLVALLVVRGGSNKSTSTTNTTVASGTKTATGTGTGTVTAPVDPQASIASCVNLWNEPLNRGDQTYLVNIMAHQPVRVHVGLTGDLPPKCEVTVVANNGDAYVFAGAGGNTYPYAQAPGATDGSSLAAEQKISNALEQRDGTLSAR